MLQREVSSSTRVHVCPTCGHELAREGDLLMCGQHGAFFAYGPHLLVRAPRQAQRAQDPQMPWEMHARARSR